MIVTDILTVARTTGIVLEARAGRLHVEAPRGTMTPALLDALTRHKPSLLAVVSRLEAMRYNGVDLTGRDRRRPVAVARLDACGGPGRCFSCGDALAHPAAYGRCSPCDVAADLFYASGADNEDAQEVQEVQRLG